MAVWRNIRASALPLSGAACYMVGDNQAFGAGWSSPVARQAHNLKVIGSNPIPATKFLEQYQVDSPPLAGFFIRYKPFPANAKEMRLNPMSKRQSAADDEALAKIPRHKSGTKRHKTQGA